MEKRAPDGLAQLASRDSMRDFLRLADISE
jgi:hypothetical protein